MINFSQVEQSVRDLKVQWQQGQLDAPTFEAQLLQLVGIGPDGYYWMFGHQSERWFRYDGQQWIPAAPPTINGHAAFPPSLQPAEWRTLDIGWFIASLVTLGVISGIIYFSAMV